MHNSNVAWNKHNVGMPRLDTILQFGCACIILFQSHMIMMISMYFLLMPYLHFSVLSDLSLQTQAYLFELMTRSSRAKVYRMPSMYQAQSGWQAGIGMLLNMPVLQGLHHQMAAWLHKEVSIPLLLIHTVTIVVTRPMEWWSLKNLATIQSSTKWT